MVSLSPDGSLSSSCLGGGRVGGEEREGRRGLEGVREEDGERGDDYSFVAFPGENGHTLKEINCRQHAMVCLLSRCATHTRAASTLCGFSSVAGGAVSMVRLCGVVTEERRLWFWKWRACLPI